MKQLMAILILLVTTSAWGHVGPGSDEKEILRFWDGTFFYNMMRVNEHANQDNIITIYLSGASLGIGSQMNNVTSPWTSGDMVRITLRKSVCNIDQVAKTLECNKKGLTYATITWQENHHVSSTFTGSIENVEIKAALDLVTVSFEIAPNNDFVPKNKVLKFTIMTNPHMEL